MKIAQRRGWMLWLSLIIAGVLAGGGIALDEAFADLDGDLHSLRFFR